MKVRDRAEGGPTEEERDGRRPGQPGDLTGQQQRRPDQGQPGPEGQAGRPFQPGWGEWEAVFGSATGGRRLRQPALARTIETLSSAGPDAFYRGPIGAAVCAHVQSLGGFLAPDDLVRLTGALVAAVGRPG